MNYTILTIEDNAEMCDNIASVLKLANYNVLTANNGKTGVTLAHQQKPDLILCDIMMPELDGFGVLHILGKDPDMAGIPFIFLTAKSGKEDFRAGMNLGADDYITKPFDGSALLKVVETRLKKHEMIKTTFGNDIHDIDDFFRKANQMKEFENLSLIPHKRIFKKKDFLFMEGQHPNDAFYIQKGEVKTYETSRDGKELITGIHHDREFIGYVPLLENTEYNETAIALTDTEVNLIPKDNFLSLIYSNKEIARKFIKLLSNNLFDAEKRLLDMAYQSVRQRVAGALLKIQKEPSAKDQELITVSRKDISSIVGTAIESLNRTLADFRDEGLIELTNHGIKLIKTDKLDRLAR